VDESNECIGDLVDHAAGTAFKGMRATSTELLQAAAIGVFAFLGSKRMIRLDYGFPTTKPEADSLVIASGFPFDIR
jgi:hypothetical protein